MSVWLRTVRSLACLACALLPAACAQPANRDGVADGRFDGVYSGTRTQEADCRGGRQSIVFHVSGSRISVRSRHKRRRLDGTVSLDGTIALNGYSDGRRITGTIGGGRLEATEAVSVSANGKHQETGENDPLAPSCLWHFEAVRGADGGESGAEGASPE